MFWGWVKGRRRQPGWPLPGSEAQRGRRQGLGPPGASPAIPPPIRRSRRLGRGTPGRRVSQRRPGPLRRVMRVAPRGQASFGSGGGARGRAAVRRPGATPSPQAGGEAAPRWSRCRAPLLQLRKELIRAQGAGGSGAARGPPGRRGGRGTPAGLPARRGSPRGWAALAPRGPALARRARPAGRAQTMDAIVRPPRRAQTAPSCSARRAPPPGPAYLAAKPTPQREGRALGAGETEAQPAHGPPGALVAWGAGGGSQPASSTYPGTGCPGIL